MDFIIGGRYQGKKEYVKQTYDFCEDDMIDAREIAENGIADMFGHPCLVGFHKLIKELLDKRDSINDVGDKYIEGFVEKLLTDNDIKVIISDEVGYGIVPLEKKDREYRELVGRLSCMIAARADKLVRVVAGIGMVIKGEKN